MNLKIKLNQWYQKGIINNEIRTQILEYEGESQTYSYALYTIITLAILSIAVGIISLFAANWDQISIIFKLSLNIMLHLSVGILLFIKRKSFIIRETLLLLEFALILTTILLLEIVFKTELILFYEMSIWIVLGGPLLLSCRSFFNHYVLLMAISATHLSSLVHFKAHQHQLGHILITAIPLLYLSLSLLPQLKMQLKDALKYFSYFYLGILLVIVTSLYWYLPLKKPIDGQISFIITLILATPLMIYLIRKTSRWHFLLFLLAICYYFAPLLFPHENLRTLGGPLFILSFSLASLLAHKMGERFLFDICTFLVGIRIFSLYFEFFGSKIYNGLGLIAAGLSALFLIWLWSKRKHLFTR